MQHLLVMIHELPEPVIDVLLTAVRTHFATVSSAGVPINTPMLVFASEDETTLDVGTGLAYPAKAERARRNRMVGLLVEGGADRPVVAVGGLATVHDADIQATTDRYICETSSARPGDVSWEVARQAVWYWTRIIVSVHPRRVLWWDDAASMDEAPHRWEAPGEWTHPVSDLRPPGRRLAPLSSPQPSWRDIARQALERSAPAHITLVEDEGFPLPIPVRQVSITDGGMRMMVPGGAPWRCHGTATLTFEGLETLVGQVAADGSVAELRVERALPVNPLLGGPDTLWNPPPDLRAALMERLTHELTRRGQPIPVLPENEPSPSAGAARRTSARLGRPRFLPRG